jgi:hypothetical protein
MAGVKRVRWQLAMLWGLRFIGVGYDAVAVASWMKKEYVPSMRYLMLWLILLPTCALAQELSVEDRACITAAAAKLPPVTALKIEGSRVVAQPSAQAQRNSKLYHVRVEIDASVAGQTSTYVFNCVRDGQLTVIQPVGMR